MRIGIVFLESDADTHNRVSALSVCSLKDYFTFLPQASLLIHETGGIVIAKEKENLQLGLGEV